MSLEDQITLLLESETLNAAQEITRERGSQPPPSLESLADDTHALLSFLPALRLVVRRLAREIDALNDPEPDEP